MTKAKKKKPKIETQTVHFSLGESFGDLITDMVREKAWYDLKEGDAIVMLVETLDVTTDQARSVIHGKQKFITNDDHQTVSLMDDDWTPPDFEAVKEEIKKNIEESEILLRRADKGLLFISKEQTKGMEILILDIKELINIHIWKAQDHSKVLKQVILDTHNDNREDLREKFEGIRDKDKPKLKRDIVREKLEAEGRFQKVLDDEPDFMKEIKADAISRIEGSDMDPKMKERMTRGVSGMYKKVEIKVDRTFEFDTGWLNREGRYYSCEIGQHIALSDKLVDKFYPKAVGDPEQILESKGWMKCTGARWYETKHRPSKAQKRTIERWKEKWPDFEYHERYSY